MTVSAQELKRIVHEIYPAIKALRRDIHKHPETAYTEVRTAKQVCAHLKKLKIPHRTKVGRTGVVGLIKGKTKGRCVALRADMDALAMQEKNRFAYRSVNAGVMHACGHDGHTADLVGVAHVLSRLRDRIRGSVKLIFQPAEEGGAGAAAMLADGAFEDPKPDVVYGLHTASASPLGKIGWRVGPICASTTALDVVFRGKGAHAAYPHKGIDPIAMAATFVQTVQTVVSRRVDPLEQGVVTFGSFHAGTARNIIPDSARLAGTARAYTKKTRDLINREVKRIARNVARAMGGTVEVDTALGYPPVVNDRAATTCLRDTAIDLLGRAGVFEADATMGGEDFAFFLEKVPGAFFRLGNGTPDRSGHNPTFDFNDESLKNGMLVMSALTINWLAQH